MEMKLATMTKIRTNIHYDLFGSSVIQKHVELNCKERYRSLEPVQVRGNVNPAEECDLINFDLDQLTILMMQVKDFYGNKSNEIWMHLDTLLSLFFKILTECKSSLVNESVWNKESGTFNTAMRIINLINLMQESITFYKPFDIVEGNSADQVSKIIELLEEIDDFVVIEVLHQYILKKIIIGFSGIMKQVKELLWLNTYVPGETRIFSESTEVRDPIVYSSEVFGLCLMNNGRTCNLKVYKHDVNLQTFKLKGVHLMEETAPQCSADSSTNVLSEPNNIFFEKLHNTALEIDEEKRNYKFKRYYLIVLMQFMEQINARNIFHPSSEPLSSKEISNILHFVSKVVTLYDKHLSGTIITETDGSMNTILNYLNKVIETLNMLCYKTVIRDMTTENFIFLNKIYCSTHNLLMKNSIKDSSLKLLSICRKILILFRRQYENVKTTTSGSSFREASCLLVKIGSKVYNTNAVYASNYRSEWTVNFDYIPEYRRHNWRILLSSIENIDTFSAENNEGDCIVCGDNLNTDFCMMICGHLMCSSCMRSFCTINENRIVCPVCRSDVEEIIHSDTILSLKEHRTSMEDLPVFSVIMNCDGKKNLH